MALAVTGAVFGAGFASRSQLLRAGLDARMVPKGSCRCSRPKQLGVVAVCCAATDPAMPQLCHRVSTLAPAATFPPHRVSRLQLAKELVCGGVHLYRSSIYGIIAYAASRDQDSEFANPRPYTSTLRFGEPFLR